MATSSTSTSSSSDSSNESATHLTPLTSQPKPTQQALWVPGVPGRSVQHQRDTGFVYNEDHEESIFNDPADLPSQLELAYELRGRLHELEERENEDRGWRDRYWVGVARGDYLDRWVRYSRWEREEERQPQQVEGEEEGAGDNAGGDAGWETARVTGGGIDEAEQQEKDEDDGDEEPNWESLVTEMEGPEFV